MKKIEYYGNIKNVLKMVQQRVDKKKIYKKKKDAIMTTLATFSLLTLVGGAGVGVLTLTTSTALVAGIISVAVFIGGCAVTPKLAKKSTQREIERMYEYQEIAQKELLTLKLALQKVDIRTSQDRLAEIRPEDRVTTMSYIKKNKEIRGEFTEEEFVRNHVSKQDFPFLDLQGNIQFLREYRRFCLKGKTGNMETTYQVLEEYEAAPLRTGYQKTQVIRRKSN